MEQTLSKDIMVFEYVPGKKFYHIVIYLVNKPGAIADTARLLAELNINILVSFTSARANEAYGYWSLFAEANAESTDIILKILTSSNFVKNVQIVESREGFITDTIHFPVAWNTGQRALLIRQEIMSEMFSKIRETFGSGGEAILYEQGKIMGLRVGEEFSKILSRDFVEKNIDIVFKLYSAVGWFKVEKVVRNSRKIVVQIKESFECKTKQKQEREYSSFVRGHLEAAMQVMFNSEVKSKETKCIAKGDDFCEFVFELREEKQSE